ncbi:hypothetical protein LSAT2_024967 [Lamellibrachia satsuma]|nr:hypothetical protein LSAT2_024967 [Lamellibrachia satsuma]
MDSFITPSLLHNVLNESLQQEGLNDATNRSTSLQRVLNSSDEVNAANYVPIRRFASFLMCVLGIPGNLLVIAIYVRKMTTSTRVYMFALAVSDLAVCVSGIVLTTVKFDNISQVITLYCVHTSIMFSVFLLAFVSIERLLAVRRPHMFSLSSLRAKRALVVIAIVAAVCILVLTVARIKRYTRLRQVSLAVIIVTNVVIIVVCYTLMAVTMLLKVRTARRKVGVASSTPVPGPSTVTTVSKRATTADFTSSKNNSVSVFKQTTANQTTTYRFVMVLFIITVVFVACWTPQWLSDVGFAVPLELRRMFILNSVVNPFIYSVMSGMFRDDVRLFYRRVRSWMSTCHR